MVTRLIMALLLVALPALANEGIVFETTMEGSTPYGFDSLSSNGGAAFTADIGGAYSNDNGAVCIALGTDGNAYGAFGSMTTTNDYLHARVYMMFSAAFDMGGVSNLIRFDDGGTVVIRLYALITEEFKLQVRRGGFSVYNSVIGAIESDLWYKFDFMLYAGGLVAGDEFQFYMQDTLVAGFNGDFRGDMPDQINIGNIGADIDDAGIIYFDDVVVDTSHSLDPLWIRPVIADVNSSTLGGGWSW